jgi:hypothetical protein
MKMAALAAQLGGCQPMYDQLKTSYVGRRMYAESAPEKGVVACSCCHRLVRPVRPRADLRLAH